MKIKVDVDDEGYQILPELPEGWYYVYAIDGFAEATVPCAQLAALGGHISCLQAYARLVEHCNG